MPGGIRKRVASLPARVRGRLAAWWGWTLTRVDNVPRIARWEVTKNAGGADRRTLAVALLAVAGIAVLLPLAAGQGVALDEGIYRVGVSEESPIYGPVDSDGTFSVEDPDPSALESGRQEVLVRGAQVRDYADTQKGRAAASELRATVEGYNDALMREEVRAGGNSSAAFPVVVNLTYAEQNATRSLAGPDTGGETLGSAEGEDDSGNDGDAGGGGGADGGAGGTEGDADDDGTDSGSDDGESTDPPVSLSARPAPPPAGWSVHSPSSHPLSVP
jgi:hypothetical protein